MLSHSTDIGGYRNAGRRGRRPLRRLSGAIRALQRGPPGVAAPTAKLGRICFIGTALSSNVRCPPAPLLRGGGTKTGAGAIYRNRPRSATLHGRTHGSAPTGNARGYPIQPTLVVVETRVAGDGDPYGFYRGQSEPCNVGPLWAAARTA